MGLERDQVWKAFPDGSIFASGGQRKENTSPTKAQYIASIP